jgi:hypothetical protein
MDTTPDMLAAAVHQDENGKTVPRRAGTRSTIPTTWQGRLLSVEHVVGGATRTTAGTLADTYPAGLTLLASGTRLLISWDSICTVVLEAD